MDSTLVQIAGEAVSLEFCGMCKDSYTKWKHRARLQCDCDSEGAGRGMSNHVHQPHCLARTSA